jgi:hypothetical protein
VVQERSRVVGPLEKRVAQLEALILTLERDRDNTFQALAGASARGDVPLIAELSRKAQDIGPRIDAAYVDLEKASLEFERLAKQFDDRLREMS